MDALHKEYEISRRSAQTQGIPRRLKIGELEFREVWDNSQTSTVALIVTCWNAVSGEVPIALRGFSQMNVADRLKLIAPLLAEAQRGGEDNCLVKVRDILATIEAVSYRKGEGGGHDLAEEFREKIVAASSREERRQIAADYNPLLKDIWKVALRRQYGDEFEGLLKEF